MKLDHLEHIGIAVSNLDEAIKFYEEKLGLKGYAVEEVAEQKVRTAFFKVGQTKIELLESTAPDGPIGKFIEKKGQGIQHIAFAAERPSEPAQGCGSKRRYAYRQSPAQGRRRTEHSVPSPEIDIRRTDGTVRKSGRRIVRMQILRLRITKNPNYLTIENRNFYVRD